MPLFTPIGPAASPRTKPAPGTPAARALALAPSAPSALVPHTNGLTSKKPPSNDGHPDGLVAYQFARALEQMLVRQETRRLAGDGDAVMSDAAPPSAGIPLELSLQLVTAYEAICEEEAARLDTLLSHSSAGDAAPALAAEREVLRGERNSWNLLRWLYHDWTAGRQAAPPAFPEPPADWARALRELGPQPGGGESSPSPTPGGLSGAPAEAGLACALLHDEAVQEAAILAADPLLDLGLRAVAWLEGIAADALRTKGYAALDAHPRNTAFLINQGVGDAPSSLDPDAPFREGKSLDGRDLEAQAAMLRALWHYVRAGQIREAQEYCRASRQWWRAASIGGGTAWQWDASKGKWLGNPRRSLWRGACAAIAKRAAARKGEAGYDDEAAVYAVLSDCVEVRLATPPPTTPHPAAPPNSPHPSPPPLLPTAARHPRHPSLRELGGCAVGAPPPPPPRPPRLPPVLPLDSRRRLAPPRAERRRRRSRAAARRPPRAAPERARGAAPPLRRAQAPHRRRRRRPRRSRRRRWHGGGGGGGGGGRAP